MGTPCNRDELDSVRGEGQEATPTADKKNNTDNTGAEISNNQRGVNRDAKKKKGGRPNGKKKKQQPNKHIDKVSMPG